MADCHVANSPNLFPGNAYHMKKGCWYYNSDVIASNKVLFQPKSTDVFLVSPQKRVVGTH